MQSHTFCTEQMWTNRFQLSIYYQISSNFLICVSHLPPWLDMTPNKYHVNSKSPASPGGFVHHKVTGGQAYTLI